MNLGTWAVEEWKMHSQEANARLFRRRHQITFWLVGLTLSLNVVLPIACIKLLGVSKNTYEDLGIHYTGVLVFFAAPYLIFRFRCPRCNATPASSKAGTSGVPLFPKSCANCKSPLLPKHRWAVD